MELDKRIIKGKKPLSYFDAERGKEFIGKECYFSDMACKYEDLDTIENTDDRTLYIKDFLKVVDTDCQDRMFKSRELGVNYRYCLPCEWVKEEKKEPKYREYKNLDEFLDVTGLEIGDLIHLKFPGGNDAQLLIVGGCDDCLFIGIHKYTFKQLFEMVEISISGEWQPFGVLEE